MLRNDSVDTIAVVCEERWTALLVGPDGRYFPLLPLPWPGSMSSFSLKGKRNNYYPPILCFFLIFSITAPSFQTANSGHQSQTKYFQTSEASTTKET